MKARIITLLAAIMLTVSPVAFAQKQSKDANLAEVTFLTSIECKNCEKKCTANLPYEKGVREYRISLSSQTIYFKFDSLKTSREKLAKAIEKLGYTATEIETVHENK